MLYVEDGTCDSDVTTTGSLIVLAGLIVHPLLVAIAISSSES